MNLECETELSWEKQVKGMKGLGIKERKSPICDIGFQKFFYRYYMNEAQFVEWRCT